jgi:hypothetical protein
MEHIGVPIWSSDKVNNTTVTFKNLFIDIGIDQVVQWIFACDDFSDGQISKWNITGETYSDYYLK